MNVYCGTFGMEILPMYAPMPERALVVWDNWSLPVGFIAYQFYGDYAVMGEER